MTHQIKSYIKFLIKSTNQHGVHSPFVYSLVTKCFYNKSKHEAYKSILHYKKELLKNNTKLTVTNLGVGALVTKEKQRFVSEIAKNAGTTTKRAKLLYRFTAYFKANSILELGTSLGIATHSMQLGNPKTSIISIEGCPNISNFTKTNFEKLQLKNIHLLNGDFSEEIKNIKHKTFDLIFFDGNHQKEVTLGYFEALLQTANNNSVFIFNNIYWSKSVTEGWETIKKHPQVTITIDTFYWGFVFFRKEQLKEHFVIRV